MKVSECCWRAEIRFEENRKMAPSFDRNGFWGPRTSNIDWCEDNYEVGGVIRCECISDNYLVTHFSPNIGEEPSHRLELTLTIN